MRTWWIDVRNAGEELPALLEQALHHRVDGVVAGDPAVLAQLPPTTERILFVDEDLPDDLEHVDVAVVDHRRDAARSMLAEKEPRLRTAPFVDVVDHGTLTAACDAARREPLVVVRFRDPTKIPLEILLAAGASAESKVITVVNDLTEAEIVYGVLERGSDGVLLAPGELSDVAALASLATAATGALELVELRVDRITHVGMGDRACVDTCSHLRKDEGILVGSHSKGMILCCSETHPLPYMPTRPFRVNAGAIHSYTLGVSNRTNYLSELTAGSKVTAVDTSGRTRIVTVGRVKIESRPLLSIDATAPNGQPVNVIVQDDWHVRVLGPGGAVHNVTHLQPGDLVLGYLPTQDRHVGYPIDEFCVER